LRARERLDAATVTSFPYMDRENQERVHARWKQEAGMLPDKGMPSIPWDQVRQFVGAE